MILRISLLLFVSFIASSVVFAQKEKEIVSKLKPIVQVFGTATYDFENERYSYGFGRAHLGFQYQFNDSWSAKMIIDRGRPTTVGDIIVSDNSGNVLNVEDASNEGSYYTMYLKFASLQWKINEHWTIEGGSILQNHYITQERFWGLRYVAQTFQDLYWKIPSADLGFIAKYRANGVLAFDVAFTNGEGPRMNQDKTGKVKIAAGMDVNPNNKIQTRLYYHYRESDLENSGEEQLMSAFAGIKPVDKLRVGAEINLMRNLGYNNGMDSYGMSLFSVYSLSSKTEIFARYDRLMYDISPALSTVASDGNTVIGGVSYSPLKGINLSVNYQGWFADEAENQNCVQLSMEYKF